MYVFMCVCVCVCVCVYVCNFIYVCMYVFIYILICTSTKDAFILSINQDVQIGQYSSHVKVMYCVMRLYTKAEMAASV